MSRLFVFGIGGTGSRVIRSLTYLLASGVKLDNFDEVVPIIIDPDAQNADMTRTVSLLRTYKEIHDRIGSEAGFFSTKINTLNNTFIFDYGGMNQRFSDFIDRNTLDPLDVHLTNLLFDKDNLENSLDIGFRGSPNVGSIVLNQLINSQAFLEFANNFNNGDRIFIISSIFGGTGAAGFPLLLKNLRRNDGALNNSEIISRSTIGAVTVLPYFRLGDSRESPIDSNTFITKTKSALSYYSDNLDHLNALYYIGQEPDSPYPNVPGGAQQKNKAHVVEFISALAALDFSHKNFAANSTDYLEFGLKEGNDKVNLRHFDQATQDRITNHLISFKLFSRYLISYIKKDNSRAYYKNMNLSQKLNSSFFTSLNKFVHNDQFGFFNFLKELSEHQRAFTPFFLDKEHLGEIINGYEVEKRKFFSGGLNENFFIKKLNEYEPDMKDSNEDQKFVKLMHKVSHRAIIDKVKLN